MKLFKLVVEVNDGKFSDRAKVDIDVLDVNQNKPVFREPSSINASILIPEVRISAEKQLRKINSKNLSCHFLLFLY